MKFKNSKVAEAAFWSKASMVDGQCWRWNGFIDRDGYGRAYCWTNKKMGAAHRIAYVYAKGPIPAGLTIDHVCCTTACVNPSHLRACTDAENTMAPWSSSPIAANTKKTHCKHGHEFTPANTYSVRGRWRECRQCRARASRHHNARRRELLTS